MEKDGKTIDQQIAELQRQKEQQERDERIQEAAEERRKRKGVLGKYYKFQTTHRATVMKFQTNIIYYMHILQETKYGGGSIVNVDRFHIATSPVGFYMDEQGRIRHNLGKNVIGNAPQKTYERNIKSGAEHDFNLFNFDGYTISPDLKTISCNDIGYPREHWEEVSKAEFEGAYNAATTFNSMAWTAFSPFLTSTNRAWATPVTSAEQEKLMPEINEAQLQKISDLISALDNKSVTIKMLVDSLAGKVAKWNYFNHNGTLPELAQYNLRGDKGLSLDIVGGDDGTDYEPYTTHYKINSVSIDWYHVLYPIRTRLKISVKEMVAKLEKLRDVYNPHYWECNYSRDSYDAVFHSAKLHHLQLQKVNDLITSNLK